jgi:MFS family permease
MGLSTFLIGPFFSDKNLGVMLLGLVLTGSCMGPLAIPNMAEMMDATKLAYPNCDLHHANSLLSGILNSCFGVGQAAGPLLGAFLTQVLGFR